MLKEIFCIIVALIIFAGSLLCPLCEMVGRLVLSPWGFYFICQNGHTWQ